jgi:hypothetical protein
MIALHGPRATRPVLVATIGGALAVTVTIGLVGLATAMLVLAATVLVLGLVVIGVLASVGAGGAGVVGGAGLSGLVVGDLTSPGARVRDDERPAVRTGALRPIRFLLPRRERLLWWADVRSLLAEAELTEPHHCRAYRRSFLLHYPQVLYHAHVTTAHRTTTRPGAEPHRIDDGLPTPGP